MLARASSVVFLFCALVSATAAAGPWVQLPDAVAQLQVNPRDQSAIGVLDSTADAIRAEAQRGNLSAVSVMMEVYSSLVMQLPDGESRLEEVASDVAGALVASGERVLGDNVRQAASAWTLAATYDPTGRATGLLRDIFLPPAAAEHGQTWLSPLDGAELVYLIPSRVRVGCSDNDRRCRDNEIYFRWIETPAVWVETREVSSARYRACVDAGMCSSPQREAVMGQLDRDSLPAIGVSWRQARDYARWLGRSLPSESVWERAARAGDDRWRYPWGNARRPDLANVWDESMTAVNRLLPGGSFPPTGPGLFDLAGSVWEWCEDRYQPGLKQLPRDGTANREGFGRVVRGGSWRRDVDLATVSTRSWYDEDYAADDVGFRCVMPAREEVSDAQVLATAVRSFAVVAPVGDELARASMSAEDRRYLDRRAITWLLLEKRVGDAALQSASLLRREPRDTVALDVLDRVPDEMIEAARAGELEVVATLSEALDRASAVSSRFVRLQREIQPRLVEALLGCGKASTEAGDRQRARACLEAGLEIDPTSTMLRRALTETVPRTGEVRISASDRRAMVWVPGGSYRIGASEGDRQAVPAELPPRNVVVSGFWIDRDEVTNADYRRCVEAGACSVPEDAESFGDPNRGEYPVLRVSWFQAREFAAWSGKRLPTEAEWEIAARTGGDERYPWGNQWQPGRANAIGTDNGDRWGAAAPVGSFPANSWGARDMIGNAAEWVEDVFHPNLAGLPSDGGPWLQETGPSSERLRVIRGGSYADPASRQRVSRRDSHRPESGVRDVGFRCVAD